MGILLQLVFINFLLPLFIYLFMIATILVAIFFCFLFLFFSVLKLDVILLRRQKEISKMRFDPESKVYVLDNVEQLEMISDEKMGNAGHEEAVPLYKRDKSPEMKNLWFLSMMARFAGNFGGCVSEELQTLAKQKLYAAFKK